MTCTQIVHTIILVAYQWDTKKAISNLKDHEIDFADTIGIFEDEWALTTKEHYVGSEQRFVTIGMDFLARILVVVYTYRGNDVRIILARKATKNERKIYEKKRI